MNLLGWYDTNDLTGGSTNVKSPPDEFGGIHELVFAGTDDAGNNRYINKRPVQKYYQKKNGNYLPGFAPQYHPTY